jgi:hypothetical protein
MPNIKIVATNAHSVIKSDPLSSRHNRSSNGCTVENPVAGGANRVPVGEYWNPAQENGPNTVRLHPVLLTGR